MNINNSIRVILLGILVLFSLPLVVGVILMILRLLIII